MLSASGPTGLREPRQAKYHIQMSRPAQTDTKTTLTARNHAGCFPNESLTDGKKTSTPPRSGECPLGVTASRRSG